MPLQLINIFEKLYEMLTFCVGKYAPGHLSVDDLTCMLYCILQNVGDMYLYFMS